MRRITFKNPRQGTLVGNLYTANSHKIIIMAHGFTNNKSSQGRFDRIADALNQLRFNVLAFDFSGCGESDPEIIHAAKEVEDLHAAIDYALSKGYKRIGLFGNSLGTLICMRCYRPEIDTMVLMGALTHRMNYDWYEEFTHEQMEQLQKYGVIELESPELGRRRIDRQTLKDFEEIDQEKLLSSVKSPVLLIHGNNTNDKEEIELLAHSRKGMHFLPKSSELSVVEGARHGCSAHMDDVIKQTTGWFLRHMGDE